MSVININMNIPALVIMKNGKIVRQPSGARPGERILGCRKGV